jgi:hypothetical protein
VIYYLKDLSIAHGFAIMRMHTSTNSLKEAKTKKRRNTYHNSEIWHTMSLKPRRSANAEARATPS